MESGQGVINFPIEKPEARKPFVESRTNSPGVHVVELQPDIKWEKKPLPEKIPLDGLHGGILFRKYDTKIDDKDNPGKRFRNLDMYVPDIGFGAGGLVPSGAGPVLIGSASMGYLTHICLPWIAIILIVTSCFWAVRYILAHVNKRSRRRDTSLEMTSNSRSWISEVIEKDQISNRRTPLQQTPSIHSYQNFSKRSAQSLMEPMIHHVPSVTSNYNGSIQHSLLKSTGNSIMKGASTVSILSYSSTMMGSAIYETPAWRQAQLSHKPNQIAVCQEKGLLFTVSDKRCPNSYSRENLDVLRICKHRCTSKNTECAEVLLLSQGTILVGKMKASHDRVHANQYTIETWSTIDGTFLSDKDHSIPCISMCAIKDQYLVVLNQDQLMVLQPESNASLAQTHSPLASADWESATVSMEVTKDMNHIIVRASTSEAISFYVFNVDTLLEGGTDLIGMMYHASSFALISSSEIIIALISSTVFVWNFLDNSEDVIFENSDQEIERILPSPSQKTILIQYKAHISIFEADTWMRTFDIPVTFDQVYTLAFSTSSTYRSLLAVALESGLIQIFDSSSTEIIRQLTISTPVTHLMFDDDEHTLLVLSDRASHFRLKRFQIS